jgi:hypothetical protein
MDFKTMTLIAVLAPGGSILIQQMKVALEA